MNTGVLPRVRLTALDEIIVLHFVNTSAQHSPHNDMLKQIKAEDKGAGGTSAVVAAALNRGYALERCQCCELSFYCNWKQG